MGYAHHDLLGQCHEQPRPVTGVALVDQNGAATQHVTVALLDRVHHGVEQRVSRRYQHRRRAARPTHVLPVEARALVAAQDRPDQATSREPVT